MSDTRERLARDLAYAIRWMDDDDAGDLELAFQLLDAMREVAREECVPVAELEAKRVARVAALEQRIDKMRDMQPAPAPDPLLSATVDAVERLAMRVAALEEWLGEPGERDMAVMGDLMAQDHGGTAAPGQRCPSCGKPEHGSAACSAVFAASVQPAPAPEPSEAAARAAYHAHVKHIWDETLQRNDDGTPEWAMRAAVKAAYAVDLPRLEREAGERMVREFIKWLNPQLVVVDSIPTWEEYAERFLKEGT